MASLSSVVDISHSESVTGILVSLGALSPAASDSTKLGPPCDAMDADGDLLGRQRP
jgi:hypothetical protein